MNPLQALYRSELWAMEPRHLRRFLDNVGSIDANDCKEAGLGGFFDAGPSDKPAPLDVRDGVAHIAIEGVILKQVPGILRMFGVEAASTVDVGNELAEALASSEVKAIALDIDSPGGSVSGVQQLADAVYEARGVKPVVAHASGMAASAAYWIASQADSISADRSTSVGSIGVYTVMEDMSQAAEEAGVVVHVISNHELKGAGVPGAPVTQAQLQDAQREIDAMAALFVESVARGRDITPEQASENATGQTWLAPEAVTRGLIDTMQTAAAVQAALAGPEEEEEEEEGDPDPEDMEEGDPEKEETAEEDKEEEADPEEDEEEGDDDEEPEQDEEEDEDEEEENKRNQAPKKALDIAAAQTAKEADVAKESNGAATVMAENEQLREQLAAKEADIKAADARAREALMRQHADRVTATNRAQVAEYGEFCGADLDKFEAFLKGLPVQAHAEAVGADAGNQSEGSAPADVGMVSLAGKIGSTPEAIEKFENVVAATSDGKYILRDGRTVAMREF